MLVIGETRLIVSRIKNSTVRVALDLPDHVDVQRLDNPDHTTTGDAGAEASASTPEWAVTARRGGPRR